MGLRIFKRPATPLAYAFKSGSCRRYDVYSSYTIYHILTYSDTSGPRRWARRTTKHTHQIAVHLPLPSSPHLLSEAHASGADREQFWSELPLPSQVLSLFPHLELDFLSL